MTPLLHEAVARLSDRPPADQDQAAEALVAFLDQAELRFVLTPDQIEEARRIEEDLRTGRKRLATDEEVDVLWRSFGASS